MGVDCRLSALNTQRWWGHSNPTCCNYIQYRPQRKLREGNIFTPVCDSVHMGGGSLSTGSVKGSLSRGSLTRASLSGRGCPYGKERAVRILLECILV